MGEKFQFEKINIEYLVAVVFLGVALIIGIIYGEKELAINIASGIIGYIGGRGVGYAMARTVVPPATPTRPTPTDRPGPPRDCPVINGAKKEER